MSYLTRKGTKNHRDGYALLLGLIVIFVLGMIMYWTKMHGDVYEIGVGKSDIDPPWRQWQKMDAKYNSVEPGPPKAEQLQLTKPLAFAVEPGNRDAAKAGKLVMMLMPDGTVRGQWAGTFDIAKDIDYQVMGAQFKGHIDPERMCVEDGWDEPSKLFFLTRGSFTILETNDGNGQCRSLGGDLYVRGWISTDSTIDGELIITNNEKQFRRFVWQGKASANINEALFGSELDNILGRRRSK